MKDKLLIVPVAGFGVVPTDIAAKLADAILKGTNLYGVHSPSIFGRKLIDDNPKVKIKI